MEYPQYYLFNDIAVKIVLTESGGATGFIMQPFSGKFKRDGRLVAKMLLGMGNSADPATKDEFVEAAELDRLKYLRGDGPQFAIYETIKGIFAAAKEEDRAPAPEEWALVRSLYRQTYAMWAAEWGDEGDPPDVVPDMPRDNPTPDRDNPTPEQR